MSTYSGHTARIGEQAGGVLYSQWSEFCRLRLVVLDRRDTDSIHDLRVASRRLRATLGLFFPFISGKALKTLAKDVQKITRALGHVRNIDEAILYFDAQSASLPLLSAELRRARDTESKAVVRSLKAFECRETDRVMREAVAGLTGGAERAGIDQRLAAYLSETSLRRYRQLADLLAPATSPENVEGRHRLRIAIKKWRYLLEVAGQLCGQDYGATLAVLKEYQTLLGSLNDMVEFAALSARLMLPAQESHEIRVALERDAAVYLTRFIELAASQPLQYTVCL